MRSVNEPDGRSACGSDQIDQGYAGADRGSRIADANQRIACPLILLISPCRVRVLPACEKNMTTASTAPKLEGAEFATLLGVSAFACESYECGKREPAVDFLVALRR